MCIGRVWQIRNRSRREPRGGPESERRRRIACPVVPVLQTFLRPLAFVLVPRRSNTKTARAFQFERRELQEAFRQRVPPAGFPPVAQEIPLRDRSERSARN